MAPRAAPELAYVALAVSDLERALGFFHGALGLPLGEASLDGRHVPLLGVGRTALALFQSDEPSLGWANHDCNATPQYCVDMEIVSNSHARVRETRDSYLNGRVYNIHYTVSDNDQNASVEHTCQVGVRLWSTHIPVEDAPECTLNAGDTYATCN